MLYKPFHDPLAAGFSLLEMLVFIGIIGLFFTYFGPLCMAQLSKSDVTTARQQVETIARALEAYHQDMGSYPASETGLLVLHVRPENQPRWKGPYLPTDFPVDPWGTPYFYRNIAASASGRNFELISYGQDGRLGGSGDNADIRY